MKEPKAISIRKEDLIQKEDIITNMVVAKVTNMVVAKGSLITIIRIIRTLKDLTIEKVKTLFKNNLISNLYFLYI